MGIHNELFHQAVEVWANGCAQRIEYGYDKLRQGHVVIDDVLTRLLHHVGLHPATRKYMCTGDELFEIFVAPIRQSFHNDLAAAYVAIVDDEDEKQRRGLKANTSKKRAKARARSDAKKTQAAVESASDAASAASAVAAIALEASPYSSECIITHGGIIEKGKATPEFININRLSNSHSLRKKLWKFFKDELANYRTLVGDMQILIFESEVSGPDFFPRRRWFSNVARPSNFRHGHCEADPSMAYWSRVFNSRQVLLRSIDSDLLPITAMVPESQRPKEWYWNTAKMFIDVNEMHSKLCSTLQVSSTTIALMCILCGTDYFEKSRLTDGFGYTYIAHALSHQTMKPIVDALAQKLEEGASSEHVWLAISSILRFLFNVQRPREIRTKMLQKCPPHPLQAAFQKVAIPSNLKRDTGILTATSATLTHQLTRSIDAEEVGSAAAAAATSTSTLTRTVSLVKFEVPTLDDEAEDAAKWKKIRDAYEEKDEVPTVQSIKSATMAIVDVNYQFWAEQALDRIPYPTKRVPEMQTGEDAIEKASAALSTTSSSSGSATVGFDAAAAAAEKSSDKVKETIEDALKSLKLSSPPRPVHSVSPRPIGPVYAPASAKAEVLSSDLPSALYDHLSPADQILVSTKFKQFYVSTCDCGEGNHYHVIMLPAIEIEVGLSPPGIRSAYTHPQQHFVHVRPDGTVEVYCVLYIRIFDTRVIDLTQPLWENTLLASHFRWCEQSVVKMEGLFGIQKRVIGTFLQGLKDRKPQLPRVEPNLTCGLDYLQMATDLADTLITNHIRFRAFLQIDATKKDRAQDANAAIDADFLLKFSGYGRFLMQLEHMFMLLNISKITHPAIVLEALSPYIIHFLEEDGPFRFPPWKTVERIEGFRLKTSAYPWATYEIDVYDLLTNPVRPVTGTSGGQNNINTVVVPHVKAKKHLRHQLYDKRSKLYVSRNPDDQAEARESGMTLLSDIKGWTETDIPDASSTNLWILGTYMVEKIVKNEHLFFRRCNISHI